MHFLKFYAQVGHFLAACEVVPVADLRDFEVVISRGNRASTDFNLVHGLFELFFFIVVDFSTWAAFKLRKACLFLLIMALKPLLHVLQ